MPASSAPVSPPPPSQLDRLCSDKQLAKRLGVSRQTLHLWRKTLGLPCLRVSRHVTRYDVDAVYAWMAAREPVAARGRGAGRKPAAKTRSRRAEGGAR